jgi:hypothetical protein
VSARADRLPAPTWPVAWHYVRVMTHTGAVLALLWGLSGAIGPFEFKPPENMIGFPPMHRPFNQFPNWLDLVLFLPLLHWRRGGRGELDAAVPMGAARHQLIRAGVGAAWTAVALIVAAGGHSLLVMQAFDGTLNGFPAWYPVSIVTTGLALYLCGTSVVLLSERAGRVLLLAYFLGRPLLAMVGEVTAPLAYTLTDVDELPSAPTFDRWLVSTALALGVSVAAVLVAATAERWLPPLERGPLGRAWRTAAHRLRWRRPLPAGRASRGGADVRRPASAATVLWREIVLLGARLRWPLLLALLAGGRAFGSEMAAGSAGPVLSDEPMTFRPLFFATLFLWPMLVWLGDRDARRDVDAAVPAATMARHLARVAAGAVWLLAAVLALVAGHLGGAAAAGRLASAAEIPAYALPGLPLAALAMYLLGSVPAIVTRHPVRDALWFLAALQVLMLLLFTVDEWSLSPHRLTAPFHWAGVREWSTPAALLWIPVLAALTYVAAAARTRFDRGKPLTDENGLAGKLLVRLSDLDTARRRRWVG